ncbi:MAG: nitroreductase family protein [Clostridium sp.]|uniref:nitroreductase family protein n=1 Tax=Clostridium sp. TaxID=1506 RepID=UPI00303F396E
MNEVLKNIKTRRSIRNYTEAQIPSEDLNLILEAGTYASSGMNKQSWKFTAIQNNEKLMELAAAIKAELCLPEDKEYNFYKAPSLIIVSDDRNSKNGHLDCSAALENIFLAAHSLGIGSCWINQLGVTCDTPQIRSILTSYGIPETHVVWGSSTLGYAASEAVAPERKKHTITIIK